MHKKFDLILNYSLFILFIIGLTAGYAWDNEKIERSFSVNPEGTLTLDSDAGSIEVQTRAEDKVNVEVIPEFRGWDKDEIENFLDDFQIDFKQNGDDVVVTARLKRRWKDFWNHVKIKFYVDVPTKYNVDLKTAGGSISVEELEGKVDAHTSGGSMSFGFIKGPVNGQTSGGSISLQGCDGEAYIRTSGGSISIGDVNGDVDAHTSGGSITIERAEGGVSVETSGGSIHIDEVMGPVNANTSGGSVKAYIAKQPKEDCRLTTSGGSVTVYLPKNISLNIDAKTSWGKVECDLDVMVRGSQEKNRLRGEINDGGPELYLRTSGGNIYILEK